MDALGFQRNVGFPAGGNDSIFGYAAVVANCDWLVARRHRRGTTTMPRLPIVSTTREASLR